MGRIHASEVRENGRGDSRLERSTGSLILRWRSRNTDLGLKEVKEVGVVAVEILRGRETGRGGEANQSPLAFHTKDFTLSILAVPWRMAWRKADVA